MAKTLYLRNVPDEVVEQLAMLAEREGMSTSAFAVRELGQISRRARNAALLASLPSFDVSSEQIVAAIREARAERGAELDARVDRLASHDRR